MLSVTLIERHFQAGRFESLLDALSTNGLELPLPLQARLAGNAAATATALGLRRLLELTYGPTGLSRAMTAMLLSSQAPDGSFGGDPLATAAGAAAFARLIQEQPTADPTVPAARQRALLALSGMQAEDGLFRNPDDRTEQDRALTAAFVLVLLADDADFRQAVRFADLMTWFEQRQARLEPETESLFELARLGAPRKQPLSPAVAAIAA